MKKQLISNERVLAYPMIDQGWGRGFVRWCRRKFLQRLEHIAYGCIELREEGNMVLYGDPASSLRVSVEVLDPRLYARLLFGGSVGSGEAYMEGLWRCSDLTTLIRIILANQQVLQSLDTGLGRLTMPLNRLFHFGRRNTRDGSRRNIVAHYDLGNDFYTLFLDRTMAYSSAIFPHSDSSLEEGSVNKFEVICRKLELRPADHLLEIGTGWGGFAVHAARMFGCRITTITISEEQYAYASRLVAEQGLADRVKVQLQDYRDIRGRFDKLVSIEMIEAVGHHYFDTFFRCCSNLLKPEGLMLLQGITIRDHLYTAYLQEVDFIRRYIFPGACLPSLARIMESLARVTDLTVFHLEDIGAHYARTLAIWRRNFLHRLGEVRALGMNDPFIRMWEFYLAYCEAGFREHHLGDLQLLLQKPGARPKTAVAT